VKIGYSESGYALQPRVAAFGLPRGKENDILQTHRGRAIRRKRNSNTRLNRVAVGGFGKGLFRHIYGRQIRGAKLLIQRRNVL
jgi:hypothetical protein